MTKRTRIPTGVSNLDRALGGGIPTGSIITLSVHPASQAELMVHMLSKKRDTYYITTERSRESIRYEYHRSPTGADMPTIVELDIGNPLENARDRIELIPEDQFTVFNPINVVESEASKEDYRTFLNELQEHMLDTDGITLLYALDGHSIPDTRDTTLNISDIILDLDTKVDSGEIINELAIPKFRGGRALDETLKLELTETVAIDTSRDIA